MEHVRWRITVVLVVVKHALEPAFLLLLELVLATQVASSNFDAWLQVPRLEAFPLSVFLQLLAYQLILLADLHQQLRKSRQMRHVAHLCFIGRLIVAQLVSILA